MPYLEILIIVTTKGNIKYWVSRQGHELSLTRARMSNMCTLFDSVGFYIF